MKNNAIILSLLCIIITTISCIKIKKGMLVSTGEASNIQTNTADVSGMIANKME